MATLGIYFIVPMLSWGGATLGLKSLIFWKHSRSVIQQDYIYLSIVYGSCIMHTYKRNFHCGFFHKLRVLQKY